MPFFTPMRYPGGKRKLNNFLKAILQENGLAGCFYVEPYAGGAGLALQLLFEGYVSHIFINDLNVSIYTFWNAVLNHTENLCRLIFDTPVTIEEWHRQKAVQSKAESLSGSLELAFSTFFLNRTNRSGIIKGGVVGGKDQSGTWKLNARFHKQNLIKRIRMIAQHSAQITVSCEDAVVFLKSFREGLSAQYFFYLDPPYFQKGAGLYDNFYQEKDHSIVATCVQKIKHPWIVSYDNVDQIRALYKAHRAITYSLHYTAQTKELGQEFMAFSDNLVLPQALIQGKSSFGCMRHLTII